MKYLIMIDYKADKGNNGFEYKEIDVKDVTEAILEADHMINDDDIYLIKLLKKAGKAEKVEGCGDLKATPYKSFLVRRRYNWHASDKDGEYVTTVKKYTSKYGSWFDF